MNRLWGSAARFLATAVMAGAAQAALAQVKVGVTLALTGSAAVLGIGARTALDLYPGVIAGQKIDYVVLDDASDTTAAVTNARKLINEERVDIVLGSSTSPQCLAMIDVVAESEVPMIAFGSTLRIVDPVDAKRRWVFKVPPNDSVWVGGMVRHMAASGVKTVGYIGLSDALGDAWLAELNKHAGERNIKVVAGERFNRTDTSVTAQALKLVAAVPDAILIEANGTPAALPIVALRERGYKGALYLNVAGATREVMQIAGNRVDGSLLAVALAQIWEQLPDSNPLKKLNGDFVTRYEQKTGKSTNFFAMQAYDAARILERAVPAALEKAKPGTREFRVALRDAIENVRDLPANGGVFNFSPTDHSGLDGRAVVMARIENGAFKYVGQ